MAGAELIDAVGSALPGFAGITVEPETCTIRVYWHGTAPASVMAVVAQLQPHMNVVVHGAAPYTHAQLTAVASRLFDTLYQGANLGVEVTMVSVRPEGTHVDVGVWPLPSAPGLDPQQAAADAQDAWAPYFPVHVTAEPPAAVMLSRWDDRPPWWAGGQHLAPNGKGACTTGWPMQKEDGTAYLLTAAHCADVPNGTKVRNGYGNTEIGAVAGSDPTLDTALIALPEPTKAGIRMWDGGVSDANKDGVNDMAEFYRSIVTWNKTFVGMLVCTSGAATGAHCNIKVVDDNLSYKSENGWKVKQSAAGQQLGNRVAVGNGDVAAVGLMAQADVFWAVDCGQHLSKQCSSRVYFTKLGAIRARWGLRNITAEGLK